MDKITHEMRLSQWTSLIRECRSSSMSIKTWCNANNVNQGQFFYWQRRVREGMYSSLDISGEKKQLVFAQLQGPAIPSGANSSFVADMVVRLGKNTLELSNSVSEELLSKVLKVLSDVE